jgi:hypothetical protein
MRGRPAADRAPRRCSSASTPMATASVTEAEFDEAMAEFRERRGTAACRADMVAGVRPGFWRDRG